MFSMQLRTYFFLWLCLTLFQCNTIQPTNIHDNDYPGDYRFETTWDSLTVNDTLEIFTPYEVPFRITGEDWFAAFYLSDATGAVICDSANFTVHDDDTTITFYFLWQFPGIPVLHGVRPNGKEVVSECPQSITVLNPYKLYLDTIQGISSENTAVINKWFNTGILPDSLRSIWIINGVVDTVFGLIKTYISPASGFTVSAALLDVYGNSIDFGGVSVSVKGYSPVIDTVILSTPFSLGKKAAFTVKLSDADSNDFSVYAYTGTTPLFDSCPAVPYDTVVSVTTHREITDTGATAFTVYVTDTTGLKSNIITININVLYTLPSPEFSSSELTIPKGKAVTLKIYDTNYTSGATYRWRFLRIGIDSIIAADSFSVTYNDTLPDTVIVSGTDRFGYTGKSDTLRITPAQLDYTIHKVVFPSTIMSNVLSVYVVSVKDTNGSLVNSNVEYVWNIDNESCIDSIYKNSDTLKLTPSDNAKFFILSVMAVVDSKDTTNTIAETITVLVKPVCNFTQTSYTVLLGDTMTFKVDINNNLSIDSIYMQFDATIIPLGKITQFSRAFTVLDTLTAYTWAIDNNDVVSDTDSVVVSVYSNRPTFNPDSGDTVVFINDTVTITLNADPGNKISTITHYFWDINGDQIFDDTSTSNVKQFIFNVPHDGNIYANCVNDIGYTAEKNFKYHIIAHNGTPIVDTAYTDTNWAYINDTIKLNITARDINGLIQSVHIDTNSDTVSDITVTGINNANYSGTVNLMFSNPGTYPVMVWTIDNDSKMSEVKTLSSILTIDAGQPYVSGLSPDTVDIKDTYTYTITAIDNKSITDFSWSLNSIDYTSLGAVNTFTHSFSDSGWQAVYLKVTDNESNTSPVVKDSVYVTYNAPVIDSISPDTAWVKDTNSYTFYFHDVNDSVESIVVSWGDGSTNSGSSNLSGTNVSFSHAYPVSNDTSYVAGVTITDNDNISVTGNFTICVLRGTPVITSISIDTTGDNLFVVDNRKYHVSVSDPNGTIKKIYFSIDGDNIAESTITFPYAAASVDTFIWNSWEITNSGDKTLRFWADDDDTISSANKDTSVTVRLCEPVLWGDDSDTTWVVVDKQPGQDFTLHINCFDTNGVFTRFYWQETSPFDTTSGSCVKTNDSTRTRIIGSPLVNVGWNSWIYGRDEDNILGGKQFIVYADSIPRQVTGLSADMQDGGDSVRLMWGLELDEKDNLETEVKLMIKYSNVGDPDSTLLDFTAAGDFGVTQIGSDWYRYFKFGKTQTGPALWRVVLRDKRGSETESDVAPFTIP